MCTCIQAGIWEAKATQRPPQYCLVCSLLGSLIVFSLAHSISKSLGSSLFLSCAKGTTAHMQLPRRPTAHFHLKCHLQSDSYLPCYHQRLPHPNLPCCFNSFLFPSTDHFYDSMHCAQLLCSLLIVSPYWNVSPTRPERLRVSWVPSWGSRTLEALRKHVLDEWMSSFKFSTIINFFTHKRLLSIFTGMWNG